MTHLPRLDLSHAEQRVLLEAIHPDGDDCSGDYDSWTWVGMALHHENRGSDQGLELWDEWSQQSKDYSRDEIENKWLSFGRQGGRPKTMAYVRRRARAAKPGDVILSPSDPSSSAEKMIEAQFSDDQGTTLVNHGGRYYLHANSHYELFENGAIDARTWHFTRNAKRQLPMRKDGTSAGTAPFEPKKDQVANVMAALRAQCHLTAPVVPCWRPGFSGPDPIELLPMSNGLLHLPTRTLMPHTSGLFTVNALPYPWFADAPRPVAWHQFLDDLWHHDPEMIDALQEAFGYFLTSDTSQQKMVLILGPKRSGKGTIGRVLTNLLGEHNVVGPTLDSLGGPFGQESLIGKQLAIVPDARFARLSPRVVPTLLSISGEDPMTIDRKNIGAWTGRLPTRFLIMSNEMPRLGDASGALASRFIVLETKHSFIGRENFDLEAQLADELPGILLWALEGLDRLKARGRLLQPASAMNTIDELEDLNSPISAFLKERCALGREHQVDTTRLYTAWQRWCEVQGDNRNGSMAGTAATFGSALKAAAGVARIRPRVGTSRAYVYQGVSLLESAGGDLDADGAEDSL